jgi:septal ring factor EnvC (AmiA/AmiB activator)
LQITPTIAQADAMRRMFALLLIFPLLAGSAFAQSGVEPLDAALQQAEREQSAAEAQTARLDEVATRARTEAERLHAEQIASAQAIEAAEARIGAADARLRLASVFVAAHRRELATEQQPLSALLAGLATMARRPPLLVVAGGGGTDELVEVRLLLASTLPVIRQRTSRVSAQLAQGQKLQQAALDARAELDRSHGALSERRRRYAALEARAVQQALATGGRALSAGDVAMAAGEDIEALRGQQSSNQSIRVIAGRLADDDPAPFSPFAQAGPPSGIPFSYQLPAAAAVTEGLAALSGNGVQSRGLTLNTARGVPIAAPAGGTIRFAGPFRDYDGVLIIDHGRGWMSLIVNVASPLHAGDAVQNGQEVGRALGPIELELSQNGRRMSAALIAGSSASLSNGVKGS